MKTICFSWRKLYEKMRQSMQQIGKLVILEEFPSKNHQISDLSCVFVSFSQIVSL